MRTQQTRITKELWDNRQIKLIIWSDDIEPHPQGWKYDSIPELAERIANSYNMPDAQRIIEMKLSNLKIGDELIIRPEEITAKRLNYDFQKEGTYNE